jgi:hypothetical protein
LYGSRTELAWLEHADDRATGFRPPRLHSFYAKFQILLLCGSVGIYLIIRTSFRKSKV